MIFRVLAAAIKKITFFCDDHPVDGGSKNFLNVGGILPDKTAHYPSRQIFSDLYLVFEIYTKLICRFSSRLQRSNITPTLRET